MSISYSVRRFLEKLGMSEWKAFGYECKIVKFEEWLKRYPITNVHITFDPAFDDKFHTYSVSLDGSELKHTTGIWRKHFTWMAKAEKQ